MNNIPLNIDWQQILLHFFNFSILVGGLYLLLFKPVKSFMEKREKHYADMEAAAVAREKDTEALKAAMAQREADFDAVLAEKRAAAAKEAEAFAQQQRDAAKAQADKILSDAKDAAESERQKIVAEANREAVAIAEDAMEKLMAAQTAQAYDAFVNAAKVNRMNTDARLTAKLLSACPPDSAQKEKLEDVLSKKYGKAVELVWQEDRTAQGGFRIELGSEVIDWTAEGRLEQLKERLTGLKSEGSVIPLIRDAVKSWVPEVCAREVGSVLTVADGIAYVEGLEGATYGEILLFEGGIRGMVQELRSGRIGCILFGRVEEVSEGTAVYRTGKTAGIGVSDGMIGRVVDALGAPIDGGGDIPVDEYRMIESPAPGIIDRQPVNTPMQTGILSIDSMFPIGRGQRELIIGDRQTGKTAIAIDTILNQKGKDMICIYVAIGQKASSVAQIAELLRKHDAMRYTIVVCAGAGESASMQYIAPYAGAAIGEYFMNKGKDVLIVYDDLSKHAIAYRALSLLLGRSPGREAYPGDVFYLHSRLLERAARLSDERGGGSMTALPIVETQAGDVSAYIPTNIISITDGQIFLESSLFFSGHRPAVNVGLSVSRVGGAAQTKAMKKAVGTLRLDLAQYREMEVFTQFSSDLDEETKSQLAYGQSLMYILRQGRSAPLSQGQQIVTLVTAMAHLYQQVPVAQVCALRDFLLGEFAAQRQSLMLQLEQGAALDDELRGQINDFARTALEKFKRTGGR